MKKDFSQIIYSYDLLNGDQVNGIAENFETMVLQYRKLLKAHKKASRAQKGSLRFRFPHETDFKSA